MTSTEPKTNTPIQSPLRQAAPGVFYKRLLFVNVVFLGKPRGRWVLIDTGLPGYASAIKEAAESIYGIGSRPEAIILTHAHSDHSSCAASLANEWDVPVYAHPLEMPYITGKDGYPPPDPTVGGGIMPVVSLTFPRGPIDLGNRAKELPASGHVPGTEGWEWIHTPGHAPGHVSLWNSARKILIAGDAVVCTRQESAYALMTQMPELNGPPTYFTQDWEAAERSVKKLAKLEPEIVISGHGPVLYGIPMRQRLRTIAANFRNIAMPTSGRYVNEPARFSRRGVEYVPPIKTSGLLKGLLGLAAVGVGLAAVIALGKEDK